MSTPIRFELTVEQAEAVLAIIGPVVSETGDETLGAAETRIDEAVLEAERREHAAR